MRESAHESMESRERGSKGSGGGIKQREEVVNLTHRRSRERERPKGETATKREEDETTIGHNLRSAGLLELSEGTWENQRVACSLAIVEELNGSERRGSGKVRTESTAKTSPHPSLVPPILS